MRRIFASSAGCLPLLELVVDVLLAHLTGCSVRRFSRNRSTQPKTKKTGRLPQQRLHRAVHQRHAVGYAAQGQRRESAEIVLHQVETRAANAGIMIDGLQQRGQVLFRQFFEAGSGFSRLKSGASFFRQTPMRVTPNWIASVIAIITAPIAQRDDRCFSRLQPERDHFRGVEIRVEGCSSSAATVPAIESSHASPCDAAATQNHELLALTKLPSGGNWPSSRAFFIAAVSVVLSFAGQP